MSAQYQGSLQDRYNINVTFAGFSSSASAKEHQSAHGGHIFVDNADGSAIWFPASITLSKILMSPLTAGRSGVINPR